ncbi:ScyD/ScyE family protein [Streptacidiphilus sp. MAP12-20]|uniref:ScyD/ScyE family protein n=1 Tax=Streptacidiphilus sp. MAP12-20 TaxID=3156299 RepID=UPI00351455F3
MADHLGNPRGLSAGPDGSLYLAEAGSGGTVCVPGGLSGTTCVGLTGSFDQVSDSGTVRRVVTHLISASGPGGIAAEGPVSVSHGPDDTFFGLFGESSHVVPPKGAIPNNLRRAGLAQLGHLVLVKHNGSVKDLSDVGDQDWTWTSARVNLAPHDFPDANPNAVLFSRGRVFVADAGSNLLDQVKRNGKAHVEAFFPVPAKSQTDSVPTCVARGPDGALYVGELLGGSASPGGARVWRVAPGHQPTVWATGLTTVQGCGFGEDGAFYATEFQVHGLNFGPTASPAGDVVRIDRWGHRTHLGVGTLFFPSGLAVGVDGSIYVSNCSIAPVTGMGPHLCSTGGQVVRIRQ